MRSPLYIDINALQTTSNEKLIGYRLKYGSLNTQRCRHKMLKLSYNTIATYTEITLRRSLVNEENLEDFG